MPVDVDNQTMTQVVLGGAAGLSLIVWAALVLVPAWTSFSKVWERLETGSQSAFPTVTGPIFEFGVADAILQMWAAYLAEREDALGDRLGCATPREALSAHEIFHAALESGASRSVVSLTDR